MNEQDLKDFYKLYTKYKNGNIEVSDLRELLRLNLLVMEVCHEIHNKNMVENLMASNKLNGKGEKWQQ